MPLPHRSVTPPGRASRPGGLNRGRGLNAFWRAPGGRWGLLPPHRLKQPLQPSLAGFGKLDGEAIAVGAKIADYCQQVGTSSRLGGQLALGPGSTLASIKQLLAQEVPFIRVNIRV